MILDRLRVEAWYFNLTLARSMMNDVLLEGSMKRIYTTAIMASVMLLLAGAAHAQVTLNSVRIGAKDTVALAKFYQAAFGMQEVNRINAQGGPEVFVNFGGTIESAKANKSEPIVIMHRDSDDIKDPIAHVILNVKDMGRQSHPSRPRAGRWPAIHVHTETQAWSSASQSIRPATALR